MSQRVYPAEIIAVLVHWLLDSTDSETVGDGLRQLFMQDILPDDVREAWSALHRLRLHALTQTTPAEALDAALNTLSAAFKDVRDAHVFWARIGYKAPTLDELAFELGVTRERVRQLQGRAEETIAVILDTDDCSILRWRIWIFGQRLGTAIPHDSDVFQEAKRALLRDIPLPWQDRVLDLALWTAGPYQLDRNAWLARQALPNVSLLLNGLVDEDLRVNITALGERLANEGLSSAACGEWVRRILPVREMHGQWYLWTGSVADKALAVLAAHAEPLTPDQIVEYIGDGHNVRGTRQRLLGDPRFVRVGRHKFGLQNWGLDEYSGIVDEITEELTRRGGEGPVWEIVEAVASTHSVNAASVTALMGVPRFAVENGRIRLRNSNEPFEVGRDVTDEPGCYLLSPRLCNFRMRVDDQLLRGSGRRIPVGLGAWLGVLPGRRRALFLQSSGQVQVSWPDSALQGPSIGSLRTAALSLAVNEGDFLVLTIDRITGVATLSPLHQNTLEHRTNFQRLAALTGLAPETGNFQERLAWAIGAADVSTLRERLRRRNEEALVDLLPQRIDDELDLALEQLREVL